jgi:6-phosphogluconolactonase
MIRKFNDSETVSRAAADLFVKLAREAVRDHGRFTVALSGGRTPLRTYQLLAQGPWRDQTPWPQIEVFWGDERCVAADDERSNARMAHRALLAHVPVAASQVHPIQCDGNPAAGAARYSEVLQTHLDVTAPALDLVFLGLGQNGHTASLFPFSPVLAEKQRWAAEVYVAEEQIYRVTLTPRIINAARVLTFLVTGRDKARILKTVLEGPIDTRRVPAQLIRPRPGRLIWMVDRAAACQLQDTALQEAGENSDGTPFKKSTADKTRRSKPAGDI